MTAEVVAEAAVVEPEPAPAVEEAPAEKPKKPRRTAKSKKAEAAAVVESVKAASDVYAPIAGEVVEANGALSDTPETVNHAPEGDGWFAKLKVADKAAVEALMDRDAYEAFLQTL